MADNTQQPTSLKMQALQNLQAQLPVANQRLAQGMKAARDLQLQQAVARAPTGAAIAPAAQQTAAAATAQMGQQQVGAAKQMIQQAGQLGQLQVGEQQLQSQKELAQAQQAAKQEDMDMADRFARLDLNAKKELYDNEMQFKKDEAGRTLFNERQLADYAKQNALSDEQYKNWSQQAEQATRRKLQAMETAFRIVEEDLTQKFQLAEQQKDFAKSREIAAIRKELQERMERERARAANNAAMWQAGGMIVGTAAGAAAAPFTGGAINPATGALIGGSLGGSLGGLAGSQQT